MSAGDTACAALGSGLFADGDALLTTGSGGQIVVVSADAATDRWYRMAAMQNVGVALEAVRGWHGLDERL